MKYNRYYFTFYMMFFFMCSCTIESSYEESKEIVIAKTKKEYKEKEPTYRIAFSSGFDMIVSFGHFSKLNEGDSVIIKHYNGFSTIEFKNDINKH